MSSAAVVIGALRLKKKTTKIAAQMLEQSGQSTTYAIQV